MVESLSGSLTMDGFLAKWATMSAREPRRALAYFLYLGYEEDGAKLFHASKPRRQERKAEQPDRSVYQVPPPPDFPDISCRREVWALLVRVLHLLANKL